MWVPTARSLRSSRCCPRWCRRKSPRPLVVNPGLGNLTNYFAQDDELIVPSELEEDEEFMARTKYPRDLKKKDE